MTIPEPRVAGFTTSTSVPLYWREDGPADAPPLLLLHGGPGAHHDYLYPQMLALAERHRLITYDQRGGGRSRTDAPAPITWETHVADMAAVVRELGISPLTVVGYSWGGLLAMLYAIEAAGARDADTLPAAAPLRDEAITLRRLQRLVLISPAPITRTWRDEFESTLLARQRGPAITQLRAALTASGLRERDMDAYRQRSFELSVAGYFADPSLAEHLTPFRVTGKVQQSVWASLGDFDLRPSLRGVHVPVLVLHGREDPIPLSSSEAVAEALQARLVVLESCGHVPYVEQPELLFDRVTQFLGS